LSTAKATPGTAATINNATLRWKMYTSVATGDDNILYLYNGTKSAVGAADVNCTGFGLFVPNMAVTIASN